MQPDLRILYKIHLFMLHRIPWLLIWLRIALTPVAVLFGVYHFVGYPYILLLAVAALSDVYDGVLARKFRVETASLRQWDSIADTIFFLGVCAGMWVAFPGVVKTYAWGIAAVLGIECVRYAYDYAKFRRGASYHALSAKVFGVSLLVATIAIMGFGRAEPFLPIALVVGIVSELEGLAMSFILKEWTYNVKHVGKALQLRNGSQLKRD